MDRKQKARLRLLDYENDWKSDWFALFFFVGLFLFHIVTTWFGCIPIDQAEDFFYSVPAVFSDEDSKGKTCFFLNHGIPELYSYPDLKQNIFVFGLLVCLMFLSIFLAAKPLFRVRDRFNEAMNSGVNKIWNNISRKK